MYKNIENIGKHNFEDETIVGAIPAMGQMLFLNFNDSVTCVQICEDDVIALANYYGHLTHLAPPTDDDYQEGR